MMFDYERDLATLRICKRALDKLGGKTRKEGK